MNKQAFPQSSYRKISEITTTMEERYYVQRITEQVFLIRERVSMDEEPGPNDRIARSFDMRHDAYAYVDTVNELQKKLDQAHGHWVQSAISAK